MDSKNNDSSFALIGAALAIALAAIALVIAYDSHVNAATTAGGIGAYTSTEGTYIAAGGFGVGTEHAFSQIFNSSGQLTLGQSGSPTTKLLAGACTIFAYSTTIAASTSAQVDCDAGVSSLVPITGITLGDNIVAGLSSTTPTTFQGLDILWVAASTTPGYITMKIENFTGTTFTWSSSASTSLPFIDTK